MTERLRRRPEQPAEILLSVAAPPHECGEVRGPRFSEGKRRGRQAGSNKLKQKMVGPAVALLRMALSGTFIDPGMPVMAVPCPCCGQSLVLTVRDLHLVA